MVPDVDDVAASVLVKVRMIMPVSRDPQFESNRQPPQLTLQPLEAALDLGQLASGRCRLLHLPPLA